MDGMSVDVAMAFSIPMDLILTLFPFVVPAVIVIALFIRPESTMKLLTVGLFPLSIVGLVVLGAIFFWNSVGAPFAAVIKHLSANPSVVWMALLGLGAVTGVGVLFSLWTLRQTNSTVGPSLVFRMLASLVLLAVVTILFVVFVGYVLTTYVIFVPFVIAVFLYSVIKWLLTDSDDQHRKLRPATPEEHPSLHGITTAVATQLDIPKPTIVLSEQAKPEAMAVGYHPGNVRLILSEDTVELLAADELEAVIAHELAHVANMDAMVMTVSSLPFVLADKLQAWSNSAIDDTSSEGRSDDYGHTERSRRGRIFDVVTFLPRLIFGGVIYLLKRLWYESPHNLIWVYLIVVAIVTKALSWPAIAVLSRSRESAADRTAAILTGSPAVLASALSTLNDQRLEATSTDLRTVSSRSSFSILPLDSNEDDTDGSTDWMTSFLSSRLPTHPPIERRIEMLQDLESKQL